MTMEFITLLIVLGLLQLWGSGAPVQRDRWFYQWVDRLVGWIANSQLRLLLAVGVPVLLVYLLDDAFKGAMFGLLSLLFYVLVLLYSLGRGELTDQVMQYLMHWNNGNFESALKRAGNVGDFAQHGDAETHDFESLHRSFRRTLVYESYQRWFAVVFWFVLLGPVGAIGYRLSYLSGRSEHWSEQERQLALRVVHYLDWIPARILAYCFALVGHFDQCSERCWQMLTDNMPVTDLLDQCAVAAIEGDNPQQLQPMDRDHFIAFGRRQLEAIQLLMSRSVLCWVALIALLALILS